MGGDLCRFRGLTRKLASWIGGTFPPQSCWDQHHLHLEQWNSKTYKHQLILFQTSIPGRSPLFGHFSTTLLGLDTIRAFGVEEMFVDQLNTYQDAHTRAWFTFIASSAWLAWRMDLLCVTFITFVSLVSPALKESELYGATTTRML